MEMRYAGTELSEFALAWKNFTDSVKSLTMRQRENKAVRGYFPFHDEVFNYVQSNKFLFEFDQAWAAAIDSDRRRVCELLLMELQAFPLVLRDARENEMSWWRLKRVRHKLLGGASTIAGSVEDILDALPPYVKGGITLFKELVDLLKD